MLHLQNVACQVIHCIAFEGHMVSEHHTSNPTYFRGFVTNVDGRSKQRSVCTTDFIHANSHADPRTGKLILNQNLLTAHKFKPETFALF